MGANTTTIQGTTVHILLDSTFNTDWDWNVAVGEWDAIVHSIQVNPNDVNIDIILRDGSDTGVPIARFNMTNADDNRIKYLGHDGTGKRCRPYIDVDDTTDADGCTIQIEII